jgi:hypothetical protein
MVTGSVFLSTPGAAAPEDHLRSVAVPRLKMAGADLGSGDVCRSGGRGGRGHRRDHSVGLVALARLVKERGTALTWVDSLVTTLPDGLKTVAYKDTSKVLKVAE